MRAVILLNGEPFTGKIDTSDAYVYCCDGAYDWAKGRVKIDENLGDFDSLPYLPFPPPKQIYPTQKDMTDGEIALSLALGRGFRQIDIYGGGGKREDHFIGNLHLLYRAANSGASARLILNHSQILSVKGRVALNGLRGRTVSVAPFGGRAHIISSRGFFYPLPEAFEYGSTRGISNIVSDDEAELTVDGTALIFINEV